MYKHTGYTFVRCLIHILPVGTALLLVGLNGVEYYIGGELEGAKHQDSQKLAGLAFAAKLHELLMLASIAAVLFSYIRKELAFGDGLPFGAVFASQQFTSINFLWSAEFLGTIYREWGQKRKKWNLLSIIFICCILGVSVGPSTNILIRPRLDDWPAGGTIFWLNATTDTGDSSCPYGDWQELSQQYYRFWPGVVNLSSLPQEVSVPGRSAIRRMGFRHRKDARTRPIWTNAYSSAWIGNSAVADAIAQLGPYWSYAARNAAPEKRLMYRNEATFAVEAPMTETFARCCTQSMKISDLVSIPLPFPALDTARLSGGPNTAATSTASFDTCSADWDSDTIDSIRSLLEAGGAPNIIWLDSPTLLNGSQSTLNAVVVFPETTSGQGYLHTCSIDSRAQPGVKITGSWTNPGVIVGYPSAIPDTGTLGANYSKIYLAAAWARYLNPTTERKDGTVISQLASTTGMWNSSVAAEQDTFGEMIEAILATMVANGISRAGYNATLLGTLKGAVDPSDYWQGGWGREFLPKRWLGGGGSAFDVDLDQQTSATKLTMHATVNGYAYSYRGATPIAAMVTLTVYSVLAILHFGWSSWTGWTSTSWDTAPEIAALTMHSEPTNRLRNTGAGIATIAVFREKVRVMARDGHVEMVFEDTQSGHSTIIENKAYG